MVSTAALVAAGLAVGGSAATAAGPDTQRAGASSVVGANSKTTFTPGRYIVTLNDAAAATYAGGTRGLAKTMPSAGEKLDAEQGAVRDYTSYLRGEQQTVAAIVGAAVRYSYTVALNGFAADLTAAQAARLAGLKAVKSVQRDELQHITAVPSTEFLGLTGPTGVWSKIGGADAAGRGVVLGVIDTGIAPENPSFSGAKLGTAAGAAPYYAAPGKTAFTKVDGSVFRGLCQTGPQFARSDCSTKIVGAQFFVDGFGRGNVGAPSDGEYLSPRDGDGHGSHTASTAAGNADVPASVFGRDFGKISGVAPAAKIASYKACWTGAVPDTTTDDGCANSDLVAAIDAATKDGVDVINFSIGGGSATSSFTPIDEAFLGAAAAGIFVAVSAGNSGPDASTADHAAPWETTVAASTIPSYEATAKLGNGQQFAGASVTVNTTQGAQPLSGPLANAAALAIAGAESPDLCLADSLDKAKTTGKIVVCDRGVSPRVDKSAEVLRAGGIGMILTNVIPGSLDLDPHVVPTVHLDAAYRAKVQAYAKTAGATATFTPGNKTGVTSPTPQVAGFSSRGPIDAEGSNILKPDITAPGVAILADGANARGESPTFEFLSGTSMSSPHIAGLAVLYLSQRPKATPGEIKSVMMTTAYNTVDLAGKPVTDPFTQGAGQVNPPAFFTPGLVYRNGPADWLGYLAGLGYLQAQPGSPAPVDASELNLASFSIGALTAARTITRTVTSAQAGTFTASVSGLSGVSTVVSPARLSFTAAGQTKSFQVTFNRTDAPLGQFSTGALNWTSGAVVARSPIAIRPVALKAPTDVTGTGTSGSTVIEVTPGSTDEIAVTTGGLTAGTRLADPTAGEKEHSGSGVAGDVLNFTVQVPAGTPFARFDLKSLDQTADLDLQATLLDAQGNPVAGFSSATGAADERIDLVDPEAGTYELAVSVFSASTRTVFDLTTFLLTKSGAPLTLSPSVIDAVQGVPATVTASWSGLKPFTSYLARIGFGTTSYSTTLQVVTGAPALEPAPVNLLAPALSGDPAAGKTLRVTPGQWSVAGLSFSYRWQADGTDIPDAVSTAYRILPTDQGKRITVQVLAEAAGRQPGTAVSNPLTVKYSSKTSLAVGKNVLTATQRQTVTVRVVTPAQDAAPAGIVAVSVNGRTVRQVMLSASANGVVKLTLGTLPRGAYSIRAKFEPISPSTVAGSTSSSRYFVVVR